MDLPPPLPKTLRSAPARPRFGVRSLIAHVSVRWAARAERKNMHPLRLVERDVIALELMGAGAFVDEAATLRTSNVELTGAGTKHEIPVSSVAEFLRLKLIRRNAAGILVITDRGRAAAVLARKPNSRLHAQGAGDPAGEAARREFLDRVRRHEKWLAGAMGGKRLVAAYVDVEGIDLSARNLAQAKLEGCILRECNLRGADLSGAELQGCDLSAADLRETRARTADLRGCDFSGARLEASDLAGSRLGPVRAETLEGMRRAHARALELAGLPPEENLCADGPPVARLERARLAGADLRGADLGDAMLRHADFAGADLREANLAGTDCAYADFVGAKLTGARWRGADLALAAGIARGAALGGSGANLGRAPDREWLKDCLAAHALWVAKSPGGVRANLSEFDLREANLVSAVLAGADLRRANLSDADLRGANLICANLGGANLVRCRLEGADLREAVIDAPLPAPASDD